MITALFLFPLILIGHLREQLFCSATKADPKPLCRMLRTESALLVAFLVVHNVYGLWAAQSMWAQRNEMMVRARSPALALLQTLSGTDVGLRPASVVGRHVLSAKAPLLTAANQVCTYALSLLHCYYLAVITMANSFIVQGIFEAQGVHYPCFIPAWTGIRQSV
jgi:hypothetical protein